MAELGDQFGTQALPLDAMLDDLADNGGRSMTVALLPGSPGIDMGNNTLITSPPFDVPPFFDQRGPGYDRIFNDTVDVGALETQALSEGEGEGLHQAIHTADQDANNIVSLSELLRVIQFFNSDGLGCEDGTEDGYAPNDPDTECAPHASDYNPQDWEVSLSELLRLIQFFNSGGYSYCPDNATEDGYCPGLA